jgi:hypothetical protein
VQLWTCVASHQRYKKIKTEEIFCVAEGVHGTNLMGAVMNL